MANGIRNADAAGEHPPEDGLQALLRRLEHGPPQQAPGGAVASSQALAALCVELVGAAAAGDARRPAGAELPAQELVGRLGRHLHRFAEKQQKELIAAFPALRQDADGLMRSLTASLNQWLAEAGDPASSHALLGLLKPLDEAIDRLRCSYRCAADADTRVQFLFALASVVRVASSWPVASGSPALHGMLERVIAGFFVLPAPHGDVLGRWLDARLERYGAAWQSAAEWAVEHRREELADALADALRTGSATAATSQDGGAGWLQLSPWPMARCPLAGALVAFLRGERASELPVGRPSLRDCPPHSLGPAALLHALWRLGAPLEVRMPDNSDSLPAVRLRTHTVSVGAGPTDAGGLPLGAGTADTAAAPVVAPSLPGGAPGVDVGAADGAVVAPAIRQAPTAAPEAAVVDTSTPAAGAGEGPAAPASPALPPDVALVASPEPAAPWTSAAGAGEGGQQPPAAAAGPPRGGVVAFQALNVRPKAPAPAAAAGAEPSASKPANPVRLGFEAPVVPKARPPRGAGGGLSLAAVAAARPGGEAEVGAAETAPKLVRRKIDWRDLHFLERLVRRGLPVDEEWRTSWQQHCEQKHAPSDFASPSPKDVLTEFVERNLYQLLNRDWAKDLMYKAEGQDDEPPKSNPGSPTNDGGSEPPIAPRTPDADEPPSLASALGGPIVPLEQVIGDIVPEGAGQEGNLASSPGKGRGSKSRERSASASGSEGPEREHKKAKKAKKEAKAKRRLEQELVDDVLRPDLAGLPPMFHKARMCISFLEGKCTRGVECVFAHSQGELKQPGEARREAIEKLEKIQKKQLKRMKAEGQVPVPMGDPYLGWGGPHDAATMMMMGVPMFMHGHRAQEAMMLNPMAMMGAPMMHPHMSMMAAAQPLPAAAAVAATAAAAKKAKKEEKAKKKKDKEKDKEVDERDQGDDQEEKPVREKGKSKKEKKEKTSDKEKKVKKEAQIGPPPQRKEAQIGPPPAKGKIDKGDL